MQGLVHASFVPCKVYVNAESCVGCLGSGHQLTVCCEERCAHVQAEVGVWGACKETQHERRCVVGDVACAVAAEACAHKGAPAATCMACASRAHATECT